MRKDYHFDLATLKDGHRAMLRGEHVQAYHHPDGTYRCLCCGAKWTPERVWAWWPVSLRWARTWGIGRHGVEIGADGIERPIVAQVWSIGPLRVCLGLGGT